MNRPSSTHGTFTRLPAHQTLNYDFRDGEIATTVRGLIDDADALTVSYDASGPSPPGPGCRPGPGKSPSPISSPTMGPARWSHRCSTTSTWGLRSGNRGQWSTSPPTPSPSRRRRCTPSGTVAHRSPATAWGTRARLEHRCPVPRVGVRGAGLVFEVSDTTMNRLHQWVHPAAGYLRARHRTG